jgi:hypothetical protein
MSEKRPSKEYGYDGHVCSRCNTKGSTRYGYVNGYYDMAHVCKKCEDEKVDGENYVFDRSVKHRIIAFIHACIAISWGPLTWVIMHALVHDDNTYRHLKELWWGIASTGVLVNLYFMFFRLFKAKLCDFNLFWHRED